MRENRSYHYEVITTLCFGLSLLILPFISACQEDEGIMKQDPRLVPILQTVEDELNERLDFHLELTDQINLVIKDLGVKPGFLLNTNEGAPWGKYSFNIIYIDQLVYSTLAKDYEDELEVLMIHEVSHFLWFEHFEVQYTLDPLHSVGSPVDLENIYDRFAEDITEKYHQ